MGGDEFTVLLDSVHGATDASHTAGRIQQEIAGVFKLGDVAVYTSVSIGIAVSTTEYESPEDLIRDADIAMYRAKAAGKARHEVFDSRMHAQAMSTRKLENDLRRALERLEFEMHYQPIVRLEQPDIVAFEALVRWRHPEGVEDEQQRQTLRELGCGLAQGFLFSKAVDAASVRLLIESGRARGGNLEG